VGSCCCVLDCRQFLLVAQEHTLLHLLVLVPLLPLLMLLMLLMLL